MTANVKTTIKRTSLLISGALFGILHTGLASASGYPVTVQSCDRQVTFDHGPKAAVKRCELNRNDVSTWLAGSHGWIYWCFRLENP